MVKKLFSIHIEKPSWEGYKYTISFGKLWGNMHGGITEKKTKNELIQFVKELFREWESPDSISPAMSGTKVTRENLDFKSFTPEISGSEFFGDKTIFDFDRRI